MITGKPIDRVDGRAKVTGAAKYAAEYNQPGMVYAVPVCATVATGAGEIFGGWYLNGASIMSHAARRKGVARCAALLTSHDHPEGRGVGQSVIRLLWQ